MRFLITLFSVVVGIFVVTPLRAQQLSQTGAASQAASLLQKSVAAQAGGLSTTDVKLSGTFSYSTGKKPYESGSAVLTALSDGTTEMVLNLQLGQVTEVWSSGQNGATITGSGPNGVNTQPAGGDISMPSPAWFAPVILTSLISSSQYASRYVGAETVNGVNVQHVVAWHVSAQGSGIPSIVERQQTLADIYLNPTTNLPVSMVFRVRTYRAPGKPVLLRAQSAREEVRYSNYQTVDGRVIPLHIQVYVGHNPIIDVAITSVAFNTGATITAPN